MTVARKASRFLGPLLLTLAANAAAQTFAPTVNFPTAPPLGFSGASPSAFAAIDFDHDGKIDLAVVHATPATAAHVSLLKGSGTGAFTVAGFFTFSSPPAALAAGDLDEDGISDLLIGAKLNRSAFLLHGAQSSVGAFASETAISSGFPVSAIAFADFNRDGHLDLALMHDSSLRFVSILFGIGHGDFTDPVTVPLGGFVLGSGGPSAIAVGDFNGDGNPDFVTATVTGLAVALGTGTGSFSPLIGIDTAGAGVPFSVAVGDFNGDGKADIAAGFHTSTGAGSVAVFLGTGTGTFQTPMTAALPVPVSGIALGDFNGDGVLDVAATGGSGATHRVFVLDGDGTGAVFLSALQDVGTDPRAIIAADFNGDAIPDIATVNGSGTVSILINTTPFLMKALAWGNNREGELGDGSTVLFSPLRVPVRNLSGLVAVAAGALNGVAVKADGTVFSWGGNFNGGLGNGTSGGISNVPVQVTGLNTAKAVAAGFHHALVIMADSTVRSWGLNGSGQLGDGTTQDRHSPVMVEHLSGVVAVAAGSVHSLALKADGTLWAFGNNESGQLGDGGTSVNRTEPFQVVGLSNVVAIGASATGAHSLAVKADGTVWAWGDNSFGQIGDGTLVTRRVPTQVPGLSAVKAVAAGSGFSLALKTNGSVWGWGANLHGQLGNGTTIDSLTPIQLPTLTGVVAVTAGQSYTEVLKADGTVWGLGANGFSGSLGDGTLTFDRFSPVQAVGVGAVKALATGGQTSVAIAPSPTVAMLVMIVQVMNLKQSEVAPLLSTLGAAQTAVDNGHTTAACAQLSAFDRLTGRLAAEKAAQLSAAAQRVELGLGCQ